MPAPPWMQKIGGRAALGLDRDQRCPARGTGTVLDAAVASASIVGARKIAPSGSRLPSSCSIAANRVAAAIEVTPRSKKSSVDADRVNSQLALPDLGQPAAPAPSAARVCSAAPDALAFRLGKRLAVDLAVRGEREARRERSRWTAPCMSGSVCVRNRAAHAARHRLAARDHVRGELRLGALLAAGDDHGLAHLGMAGEHGLDLAELDPEPANLHLVVDPPEELDLAVRPVAGEVAGPVDPRLGRMTRTGPRRTAPRSGPGGRGSRARARHRRSRARRPRRPAPAACAASRM